MTGRDSIADVLAYHVRLVLDNDEGSYLTVQGLVSEAREDEYPRHTLSESMREYVETLAGYDEYDAMPLMACELLGVAISSIDWHAMAVSYLEDAS